MSVQSVGLRELGTPPARSVNILDKIIFALLGVSLLSSPVYIFNSGLPQPGDIIFLLCSLPIILAFRQVFIADLRKVTRPMMLFVVYTMIVNGIFAIVESEPRFLLFSTFYLFDFVVFLGTIRMWMRDRDRFETWIPRFIVAALVIEALVCIAGPTSQLRANGTFNNPNQLAYWSLLFLSASVLAFVRGRLPAPILFIAVAAAEILLLKSLSKAALIASVFVFIPIIRYRIRTGLLLIILGALATSGSFLTQDLNQSTHRLATIGEQSDDSLAGRGYDRIWVHPEYTILGAGEGKNERWSDTFLVGLEIHSGPGTLLFSYGFIGISLFAAALIRILRRNWLGYMIAFPIITYSFAHNGIRASEAWFCMAFLFCMLRTQDIKRTKSVEATIS